MNYIKWPCDWNRPLSKEELQIARRLGNAPDKTCWQIPIPDCADAVDNRYLVIPAQRWHTPLDGISKRQGADASVLQKEEA